MDFWSISEPNWTQNIILQLFWAQLGKIQFSLVENDYD